MFIKEIGGICKLGSQNFSLETCVPLISRFILIACDGLFKVFTPEEAVNFIVSCLEVRRGWPGG